MAKLHGTLIIITLLSTFSFYKPWRRKATTLHIPGLNRSHRPDDPEDEQSPPTKEAQVTFLVSMPSPERAVGQPSHEYAIGTTLLPYREPEDDDDEEEEEESRSRMHHHLRYAGFS